ncbi:uncharacterized protein LOC122526839 [Frieseomelitta varia]|uniref:uncharacterized protein LOC122526839 n=1 Tax=Frieseomelitta varia TaxID=561572 RepID=UPI001CB6B6C4|nr:uncharacterized protein LOC122526839 [Frieseomelitta varia]XP_043506347.1 uncharacterized protein LOC122526839 [Frieseomelitta varia]XP_043506348.1 uncharacterized protein LOC122526839 [Frieseomelitta varia]
MYGEGSKNDFHVTKLYENNYLSWTIEMKWLLKDVPDKEYIVANIKRHCTPPEATPNKEMDREKLKQIVCYKCNKVSHFASECNSTYNSIKEMLVSGHIMQTSQPTIHEQRRSGMIHGFWTVVAQIV